MRGFNSLVDGDEVICVDNRDAGTLHTIGKAYTVTLFKNEAALIQDNYDTVNVFKESTFRNLNINFVPAKDITDMELFIFNMSGRLPERYNA